MVVETARAAGIADDEIFLCRCWLNSAPKSISKIDPVGGRRRILAAGRPSRPDIGARIFKALTPHYGLSAEQRLLLNSREIDLKGTRGRSDGTREFRRLVLRRLLEDGMADVRPGYSLEYCGLTAVDLHGVILQAALGGAASEGNVDRRQSFVDPFDKLSACPESIEGERTKD